MKPPDQSAFPPPNTAGLPALGLSELVVLIAERGRQDALREFHSNRTVFVWRDEVRRPLLLAQYLDCRRRCTTSVSSSVAARAYDLTLCKFLGLPEVDGRTRGQGPQKPRDKNASPSKGVDCRRYFAAYLKYLDRILGERGRVSPIEEERIAARVLQGFVDRQFDLSLSDALRNANPAVSRYFWRVNGSGFLLWFPRSVAGHERRQWLEANVPDPDPHRPGEQRNIQDLISSSFSVGESLCPAVSLTSIDLPDTTQDSVSLAAETVTDVGLGRAVATEKALSIDSQRRSIRQLGQDRLAQLVTGIFEALADGQLVDSEIADQFGLSKATYSRFAGSCWSTGDGGGTASGSIPDLWRNTAHVLGRNPVFREAAERAGVWPRVETVLTATQTH